MADALVSGNATSVQLQINSQKCVFIQIAEYAERVKLNSKHRLGRSPRVNIEDEKLKMRMWRNGRRAGFRFQ